MDIQAFGWAFVLLGASAVLEVLAIFSPRTRGRSQMSALAAFVTTAGSVALLLAGANFATALVCFISVYRVLNSLKLIKSTIHESYLRKSTLRSFAVLFGIQVLILCAWLSAATYLDISFEEYITLLSFAQVVVAFILFWSALRTLRRSRFVGKLQPVSDDELPTVSVCVPARNETLDLTECLEAILDSDYPKLEVLVYDDCSQKKTSEIIRRFALDGVRFIKGSEPIEGWLAKNQAYDTMADQANGEILLFCGVDVRFSHETIRTLVAVMKSRKKSMLSVLPRQLKSGLHSTVIQPMRYWWEVALPRRYFDRPPVLSTCWVIDAGAFRKLGGFDAVANTVVPETHFARQLVAHDKYSFIRSSHSIQVWTAKDLREQRETALRLRYPQIRKRLELVPLITLGQLVLLFGPLVMLPLGLWLGNIAAFAMSVGALVFLVTTHAIIVASTSPQSVKQAPIGFPIAVLCEMYIGNLSMYKYEFDAVYWKRRNICLPVMHVIPHLPKA
jgi:GT2 family glycosyltransferase